MGNKIDKQKHTLKMVDSNGGVDTKTGYKASKAKQDGLRGVPAKINKKQEYVCKDQDEADYIQNQLGSPKKYATVLAKKVSKMSDEGDDN